MLVVSLKEGESIDRLIKRYRKRCDEVRLVDSYRRSLVYEKPSERKRKEQTKAIRTQKYRMEHDLIVT